MREVIFKYELKPGSNETIVPQGSRVVHFAQDTKDGGIKAWLTGRAEEQGAMMIQKKFYVCATGEAYDSSQWTHLGTAVTTSGYVWHLLGETLNTPPKNNTTVDWNNTHANQQ
jgi:hypothetical protein